MAGIDHGDTISSSFRLEWQRYAKDPWYSQNKAYFVSFSSHRSRMTHISVSIMALSNGNIFRVTGPLCGEPTGHRRNPRTHASDAEFWCFLWVNNREAGGLRHHCSHYDVTVMSKLNHSLDQAMACRLLGTKPVHEPVILHLFFLMILTLPFCWL